MKNAKTKNFLILFLAFIASAAMLTVIQPPLNCWPLAWISLVPFILACSPKTKPLSIAAVAYLVSLGYWLGNLYWLFWVTWPGWLTLCIYTAVLWPILALGLRYCRIKRMPLFLSAAVLFVGAERLQGLFLGGFYWRFLAHSQYANITLIQIADIFGAPGLSFLIAMVNGLLAELLIATAEKSFFKFSNFIKIAVVGIALAATVIYGRWRIDQTDKFIDYGPTVASVQSNVPQSVKISGTPESDKQIFNELLENSSKAAEAGGELIVWPETMVPAVLDNRVVKLLRNSNSHKIYDEKLKEHAKNNAYLLVGATGGSPKILEDWTINLDEKYNSAFMYKPDGRKAEQQYNKIHLVPFGEVVPFKKSLPWLHNLLMKFTPYDFDYTLDAGSVYTVFEMAAGDQNYRFGAMICYEDAVPEIARKFTLDEQGRKRLDWLVNISNDGWFVRFSDEKIYPSTELSQHTAICAFRAVENRLAVLRSVNTGISCLIDTVGRIKNGYLAGNLPQNAMERTGCAGWFVDKVPIDSRTTFFSKFGQWLDICCSICLFLLIILLIFGRFVRNREYRDNKKLQNSEPKAKMIE